VLTNSNDSEITKAFTWVGVVLFTFLALGYLTWLTLVIVSALTN